METDELKEGWQLNFLIAEKVMGWTLKNYATETTIIGEEEREEASYNDGWYWKGREGDKEAWQWDPGRNIADAMEVVRKIVNTGRWELFDLQWAHPDSPVTPRSPGLRAWWACFIPFDDDAEWCSGDGDTPAIAICYAALRTAGEKV